MTPADLDKINQRVNRGLGEGLLAAARWRDALIDVGVMLVLVGPPPALDAHLRAAVLTLLDLLEARGAIWVGLGKETRTDLEASIGVVRAALRGETP